MSLRWATRRDRLKQVVASLIVLELEFNRFAHSAGPGIRLDWKRSRWPDAKFVVTGAKNHLRNEQQLEKRTRAEGRGKREESKDEREEIKREAIK